MHQDARRPSTLSDITGTAADADADNDVDDYNAELSDDLQSLGHAPGTVLSI